MKHEINELYAQFETLELNAEDEDFDPNELQDSFNELVEKVYELHSNVWEQKDKNKLEKLSAKLKAFKKEQDFYDANDELDRMFPNRGEDDFDEDSTSFESVFGKD